MKTVFTTGEPPSQAAKEWVYKYRCIRTRKGLRIAQYIWGNETVQISYQQKAAVEQWVEQFIGHCMREMQSLARKTIDDQIGEAKADYTYLKDFCEHDGEAAIIALNGRVTGPMKTREDFYGETKPEHRPYGLSGDGERIYCKLPLPTIEQTNQEFQTDYPKFIIVSRKLPNWYVEAMKTIDIDLTAREY